jgi:hypothetical protein
MKGGWKLGADKVRGEEYWERSSGDVVARVRLGIVNGSSVWSYEVSCGNHATVGYKDTERAAKAEATKLLRWYALRQCDLKRTEAGLRDLWVSGGIGEVEPVRGSLWEETADCAVVFGIKWKHDFESRIWRSGAWKLWCQPCERWMLQHPDGHVQFLHVSGRHNAMVEAAFWIARCLS